MKAISDAIEWDSSVDLFISPLNFKFVKFSSLKYEKDKKMTLTTQPIEEFSGTYKRRSWKKNSTTRDSLEV